MVVHCSWLGIRIQSAHSRIELPLSCRFSLPGYSWRDPAPLDAPCAMQVGHHSCGRSRLHLPLARPGERLSGMRGSALGRRSLPAGRRGLGARGNEPISVQATVSKSQGPGDSSSDSNLRRGEQPTGFVVLAACSLFLGFPNILAIKTGVCDSANANCSGVLQRARHTPEHESMSMTAGTTPS